MMDKSAKIKAYYIRVSTEDQNDDLQYFDNKKEVQKDEPSVQIFAEKLSGRIPFKERKQGKALISWIEEGRISTVIVNSIDRLGRSTLDILNTIQTFTKAGVNLISKREGLHTLNDDGSENITAKLMISILSTLAEWDYNVKLTAQLEGIKVAKAKGKYKGRPKGTALSDAELLSKHRKVVQALKNKNSIRDTAKIAEVSTATVQKVKKVAERNDKL